MVGKIVLKYKPTGNLIELPFGIQKMSYNNELIMCPSWGYDKGNPSKKNNPDNWEVVHMDLEIKQSEKS